jgi:aquaporin related protein
MIACLGEFVGTTMFIFLGLGCVKTAQDAQTASQLQTTTSLSNQTIIFISLGMGFSLLVTAWVFYRITGGLFVSTMFAIGCDITLPIAHAYLVAI